MKSIRIPHLLIWVIVTIGFSCLDASAATIVIAVNADTYIRANEADINQDGDPDNEIIVGTTGSDLNGLIRFNTTALSSLAGPGQTIVLSSVTLSGSTRTGTVGQGTTNVGIEVRNYAFEFIETASTWNDPDGNGAAGTGDTTPGGNGSGSLLASGSVPVAVSTPVTFTSETAFIAAVNDALAGDNTVNLWLHRVSGTPNGSNSFVRFGDEDRPTERFNLTINYTIVAIPEPSAITLIGLGFVGLVAIRRR